MVIHNWLFLISLVLVVQQYRLVIYTMLRFLIMVQFIVVSMLLDRSPMVSEMNFLFDENVNCILILAGDCYLESIVPQQTLFNLVNNQFFTNGSICTSTTG